MHAAVVCKEYGWTYEQYRETPAFFLEIISIKMKVEAEVRDKDEFRQKNAVNRNS